jgi:copper chaperone CopZ
METIKLSIPNMKSPHCQMTVTNAVKNAGASVKSIAPAAAEIELQNGVTKETIIDAIKNAGYKVNV